MRQCQISFVIPHYNSPELLIRLLKSIPDEEQLEIIVVDDQSTIDLSLAHKYIEKRKNVTFFVNDSGIKNAGTSRNIGLRHVSGKWILFADADDFFVDGFMDAVTPFLDSDYDMVFFPPTSMDLKTGEVSSRHVMYMEMVLNSYKNPSIKNITEMKYAFCSPWSKLVRTDIIKDNNIQFDEVRVSNDIMCMTKCGYYCKKIGVSDRTIYCVTRGAKSLTTISDEKRLDTRVQIFVNRYTFLREHLSKKEFSYIHLNRQGLEKILNVFNEGYGIKKAFSIMKLYRKHDIKVFDIGLLNPYTLFHKANIVLKWWFDIKKHKS